MSNATQSAAPVTFSAAAIAIARAVISDAPAYRTDRRAMLRTKLAAAKIKIPAAQWDELLDLGRPVRGVGPGAAEMTQASRVVALESDAAKIDTLLAAVRAVSFSSLCPAGRAAVGDALAALWRAEGIAAEQIKALAASAPTLRVNARIRDRGDFANVSRQGTVLGIDDGWLVIQWDEIEMTERCPAGLVGGRFSVIA